MPTTGSTILVVEDERIVSLDLVDRIERMGHHVDAAVPSASEAIERAQRMRPDLVLMDIKLQGKMDGIDAAAIIRQKLDIPIIYVTAFADEATLERAKATEPYGYIMKPFNDRELNVVITFALHRRMTARQLRESEAWRAALLKSVHDAVLAVGPDGRITFMNEKAETLTGWSHAEAIGRELQTVFELIDVPERRAPPWREVGVQTLRARDGTVRPIEGESTPILGPREQPLGAAWVFRDISERKHEHDRQRFLAIASREMSSSLDRQTVLDKVVDLLVTHDVADWCIVHLLDGETLTVSAFAHPQADIAPRVVGTEILLDDTHGLVSAIHDAQPTAGGLVSGAQWIDRITGLDVPTIHRHGLRASSYVCVPIVMRTRTRGALTLVRDGQGREFGASDLQFAEELSRLLSTATDNAELYASARRAIRMREDILGIVSHDLRNPLSSVMLNVELLLSAPGISDQISKQLASIERNADRMKRLVNDLLDVARIDAGRLSIERCPLHLRELISEVAAVFGPLASERSVELRAINPAADPVVLCDRERILQVFSNLLDNAIKLSKSGSTISIDAEMKGSHVEFHIADQAGGIAPEKVPYVFEQYWHDPGTTRGGTGLGLYITRGLVEAHGGRIWFDTEFGRGSTFSFSLPLPPQLEEALPEEAPHVAGP